MIDSNAKAGDKLAAFVRRGGGVDINSHAPRFTFHCKQVRDGQVIDEWEASNVVTTEGLNSLLDVYFDAATQITTWYLGLISSVSWSAVAATDTAAQINGSNGWKECGAINAPDYDTPAGTARGTITFGEPSAGSLAASSTVDFTFEEAGTVKGAFISSNGVQENTTGVLYSAATFSGDKTVADNDQLLVSVTVSFS